MRGFQYIIILCLNKPKNKLARIDLDYNNWSSQLLHKRQPKISLQHNPRPGAHQAGEGAYNYVNGKVQTW